MDSTRCSALLILKGETVNSTQMPVNYRETTVKHLSKTLFHHKPHSTAPVLLGMDWHLGTGGMDTCFDNDGGGEHSLTCQSSVRTSE